MSVAISRKGDTVHRLQQKVMCVQRITMKLDLNFMLVAEYDSSIQVYEKIVNTKQWPTLLNMQKKKTDINIIQKVFKV